MQDDFKNLVQTIAKIDGVGLKSAMRIAYDLAFVNKPLAAQLQSALAQAACNVQECSICGCLAQAEGGWQAVCRTCANPERSDVIALVASAKDALYIARSGGFDGRYFVLAAANEYYLGRLEAMVQRFGARELLLAHSPGVGADALCFYLENRFKELAISKIAQGVPQGIRLSDVDPQTLALALGGKITFAAGEDE